MKFESVDYRVILQKENLTRARGGNRLFFMHEKFTLGSKAWENKMKEITSKLRDK